MNVKFYYNAIKIGDNKKELANIDYGQQRDSVWRVTLYAKNPSGFSNAVKQVFNVENNSDPIADLYENDKIRIDRKSEHFIPALVACKQELEKSIIRVQKRRDKVNYVLQPGNNYDATIKVYKQDIERINQVIESK